MKTKTSERTRLENNLETDRKAINRAYPDFSPNARLVATSVGWFNGWHASREAFKKSCEEAAEKVARRAVRKALKEAATVAWSYDLATAVPLQRQIARSIEKEILALSRRKP